MWKKRNYTYYWNNLKLKGIRLKMLEITSFIYLISTRSNKLAWESIRLENDLSYIIYLFNNDKSNKLTWESVVVDKAKNYIIYLFN